jgi:autotransporter adhesin
VGGRQVTGIAAGSQDGDAVNVQQLRTVNETITQQMTSADNDLRATDTQLRSDLTTTQQGLASTQQDLSNLRSDVSHMNSQLSAGIASAMATAGLPQAFLPGHNMVSIAGGAYNGQTGYALGYSRVLSNGRTTLRAAANISSRGDLGGTVGMGYQW